MKSTRILPTILITMMSIFYSYSQETESTETDSCNNASEKGYDFFASDIPLQITLCFDIREFIRTKASQKYQDATLTVKINETDSLTQSIKIKARGFMRLDYCSFPPIMLKFKGGNPDSAQIQRKGTIKLVTHCNGTPTFENYVFKEYLVYRMYNLLTPYSFKTRLVQVNYVDVNKPDKHYTEYGILIENDDKMAERNRSAIVKNVNITQKNMLPAEMARVAIFNYMIGNTDWSVPLQHNIKVIKQLDVLSDKGIPIAYDFDYSGFVNTSYSTPFEELPIKHVTERYYMGVCMEDDELSAVIAEFDSLKDKFLSTIEEFDLLRDSHKKQAEAYINSFYKSYKSQNYLVSDLNRTCKQY
jgi:hypothetical protein